MKKSFFHVLISGFVLFVVSLGFNGSLFAACKSVEGLGCVPVDKTNKISVEDLNTHVLKQKAKALKGAKAKAKN